MGFATTAIHAGQEPDSATGAVTVPIYQTSTYAQEGLGKHKGFEYARTSNPTRLALERNLAALEGARFGYAFASGMAAIDATMRLVKAGDHVIVSDNTYMSAYLQRPIEFGVDIVVHSTTKFLNGHSDGIGGAVVLNNEDDASWIAFIQNSAGAILSPFDSWLVLRGVKTLALRMEQH